MYTLRCYHDGNGFFFYWRIIPVDIPKHVRIEMQVADDVDLRETYSNLVVKLASRHLIRRGPKHLCEHKEEADMMVGQSKQTLNDFLAVFKRFVLLS